MKVMNKLFVVALLVSLTLTVCSVTAADDVTFEQSNLTAVSIETNNDQDTLSVSTEIDDKNVDGEGSVLKSSMNEEENQLLGGSEIHVNGDNFKIMENNIKSANSGDIIYLDGNTYNAGSLNYSIEVNNNNITIYGGKTLNDNKYATLNYGLNENLSISCKGCSSITFKNIKFTNGKRPIYLDNCENIIIDNCIFENNNNSKKFGVIYVKNGKNLQIKNSVFKNNYGNYPVVSAPAENNFTLTNCEFRDNNCPAIDAKNAAIKNSTFENNRGPYVVTLNGTSAASNCNFTRNSANKFGIIKGASNSNLTVDGCKFEGNNGNATIYSKATYNQFFNNEFNDNTTNTIYAENNVILQGNKIHNEGRILVDNLNLIGETITVLNNSTLKAFEGIITLNAEIIPGDNNTKYSSDNFTFIVGNKTVTGKLVDNKAEVVFVAGLQDNGAIVSVDMPGNTIKTGSLEIVKYNVIIDFNDAKGNISSTITIPVHVYDSLNHNLNGTITAYYVGNENGKSFNLNDGHTEIIIYLPNKTTVFELGITYDGKYLTKHNIYVIDPNAPGIQIILPETQRGYVKENITIPVSVMDGANPAEGNIIVNISGDIQSVLLQNGTADIVLTLPDTPANLTLRVSYKGTVKTSKIIVIDSVQPHNGTDVIIGLPENLTGKIGETLSVYITVKDGEGHDLAGNIRVAYENYEETIGLKSGRATVVVNLPNTAKTFSLTVYYNDTQAVCQIKVIDPNPMSNISEIESNNGTLVIEFPKDATGEVIVTINGKNYTGRIIGGKVVLDVTDLENGNYNGTIYYLGDSNYPSSIKTITISIVKDSNNNTPQPPVIPPSIPLKISKITAKKKTFKKAKKVKKYKITLKSGKTPIKSVKVTLKIGKKTYKAKTNAKGKAIFKIKKLTKKGKYKAVIKFAGNGAYKPTSKKVKITIK